MKTAKKTTKTMKTTKRMSSAEFHQKLDRHRKWDLDVGRVVRPQAYGPRTEARDSSKDASGSASLRDGDVYLRQRGKTKVDETGSILGGAVGDRS